MKIANPIPSTPDAWLQEIALAYLDAAETKPFGPLTGQSITDEDLFHLAPAICIKFRGIKQTKKILEQVTEAALSSYIATKDKTENVFDHHEIAFAFCYVTSHFSLDLLDDEVARELLAYIENNLERFLELINAAD